MFYSKANLLEKIEINLQSGDYERVIIVKKNDGELILDSIKEHNIFLALIINYKPLLFSFEK